MKPGYPGINANLYSDSLRSNGTRLGNSKELYKSSISYKVR